MTDAIVKVADRARKPLTDFAIKNLKPGSIRRELPDPGTRGLYVVIQPSGAKSFAVRYRFAGEPRKLTLTAGISLAAARKAASDALFEVNQGRDPAATKRRTQEAQRQAAENTFRAIAEEYLRRECGMKRDAEGRPTFSNGKVRTGAWRCAVLERLVYPKLGGRPIGEIRRTEITRILDRIEEGNGPVMADRTLALIRKIMNWHAVRSDDFRSPIVRGMARVNASERARERTLSDDEIRAVWQAAGAGEGPFPAMVKFLLLTAARRSEAAAMTRDEVVGTDWTLPASRNKTKVDLVRPMSSAARDVLDELQQIGESPYFFTSDGGAPISAFSQFKQRFDAAVLEELRKRDPEAKSPPNWTLHDLRRTARSLMSRAGVHSDHAERCLGHVIRGVRGTYDRYEYHCEKQRAFEALAAQIERIVNPPPGNIVQFDAVRG